MVRAHAQGARQLQVAAKHVVDLADMFSVGADDVHVFADGTGVDHIQSSFYAGARDVASAHCGSISRTRTLFPHHDLISHSETTEHPGAQRVQYSRTKSRGFG